MVDKVQEIRLGCHEVKVGDRIRVLPSKPHKRDGFEGKFRGAVLDEEGAPMVIDVVGAPAGRPPVIRSLRPERIQWMRQPKGES